MFEIKLVEKIKTHILCSVNFSPDDFAVSEIMRNNSVEPERQATDGSMAIALCVLNN